MGLGGLKSILLLAQGLNQNVTFLRHGGPVLSPFTFLSRPGDGDQGEEADECQREQDDEDFGEWEVHGPTEGSLQELGH